MIEYPEQATYKMQGPVLLRIFTNSSVDHSPM